MKLVNNSSKRNTLKIYNNLDLRQKKNNILEKIKIEAKMKLSENLNMFRDKINSADVYSMDDWSLYKKKVKKTKKTNKNNTSINLFKLKNNQIILLIENLLGELKIHKKLNFLNILINKKIDVKFIIHKIIPFYKKNINNIKSKKLWKNNNNLYIIVDMLSLKTKIIVFNKNKCLITMTNGLIFKKLQFKNKKHKKSEKVSSMLIKTLLLSISEFLGNKNVIIQIKGLKKNNQTLIKNINKFFVKKINKVIYLFNPKTPKNKFFGFKKIKSIKKRLKKKIVKLK